MTTRKNTRLKWGAILVRENDYRGEFLMIFQDGEFRQVESSKPLLFDGWAYVPMEPRSAAVEAQIIGDHAPTTRDMPPAPDFTP